jgi:hypothetical protein
LAVAVLAVCASAAAASRPTSLSFSGGVLMKPMSTGACKSAVDNRAV